MGEESPGEAACDPKGAGGKFENLLGRYMRTSVTIGSVLMLVVASAARVLGGETSSVVWFRNVDNSWCVASQGKEACLPKEYSPQKWAGNSATFAPSPLDQSISLINYEFGPAKGQIDFLIDGDVWMVDATHVIGDVVVTKIVPQESHREESHGIMLSILEFDGRFTLTINSSDAAVHSKLTNSLTSQWLKSADN